jgi:chaperonin GroEL
MLQQLKFQVFGDIINTMLKGNAVFTHGRLVSETFKDFESAKTVKIPKDSTIIVDGRGDKEAIKARVFQIKAEIEISTPVLKIEKLYIINKNFLDLNNFEPGFADQ